MLVGWWLIACLVIATAFQSSLVAHLTVQSTTQPINSYKDMVKQDNWQWGIDKRIFGGSVLYYFKGSPDPLVKHVYKHLEGIDIEEGLERIREGGYSLLSTKTFISNIIASYYADDFGVTPYHISKEEYSIVPDFGWGFRKGAPFRRSISRLMGKLNAAGIIDYWLQHVAAARVRKTREEAKKQRDSEQGDQIQNMVGNNQMTLGMSHMAGVFFALLLGFSIAFLAFVGEKLLNKQRKRGGHLTGLPSPNPMF